MVGCRERSLLMMPRSATLVCALCACATTLSAPAPLTARGSLSQSSADHFTVELRLSRPVTEAPFSRMGDGDRLRTWRVVSPPNARLVATGDVEQVVAAVPFDRVVLEVPVHRHDPEKDYEPFIPFSQGGVLVFTGQFEVGAEGVTPWVFHPRAGDAVVVPGHVARGPLEFAGLAGGLYVEFGPVVPEEGEHFIAVVDRGMPAWLAAETSALLPKLFDHYTRVLGGALPVKPTVFLAYGDEQSPRTISIGGGTLEGLLQVVVRLGADRRSTRDVRVEERFRGCLGHEAAHLWNSHRAENRGPDWIHEGGAEVLSWRALHQLGLMSDAVLADRLSFAASQCLLLRGEGPLEKDPVKARYACGAVVELAASAGTAGPEAVWARLLARSRATGHYDAEGFFAACAESSASAEVVEAARRFTTKRSGPVRAELEELLGSAGLSVAEAPAPPDFAQVAQQAGKPAATWLEVRPRR